MTIMKWNLSDIPIFTAVVDHNGITAAAKALRIPKSTISRTLSRLEEGLKVRLLERNSRNMRLTHEGSTFYKECKVIMEQVESANALLNGMAHKPSGPLHVSMPIGFARHVVSGRIHRFSERYPEIELHVHISPNPIDLIGDFIDLAVQVGALPDSEFIAVPLNDTSLVWVASPGRYKAGHRFDSIDELVGQVCICETRYNNRPMTVTVNGRQAKIRIDASIETPDPIMVMDSVAEGAGVSLVPRIYARQSLSKQRLVEVAPNVEFKAQDSKSYAVYASKRMLNQKTRLFIDFLKELTAEVSTF